MRTKDANARGKTQKKKRKKKQTNKQKLAKMKFFLYNSVAKRVGHVDQQ